MDVTAKNEACANFITVLKYHREQCRVFIVFHLSDSCYVNRLVESRVGKSFQVSSGESLV